MKIHPVAIEPPEGIECRYGIVGNPEPKDAPDILVASFHGTYPDGSLGNAHGQYIASATLHGLAHFEPWCVILDFRELEYRWGNTLLAAFQQIEQYMPPEPGEPPFPFVVVTSGKCRDAFLSLVTPTGSPPDWHFDNFDHALENAVERANHWIDA